MADLPYAGPAGIETADPLQGYDIKVKTYAATGGNTHPLVGAFTSAMFKIVNQTETYLPLNSRIPRQLDGEIIIVWALEQGLIAPDVMTNTFGTNFGAALNEGRGHKIPRSSRFNISFLVELAADELAASNPAIFDNNFFSAGAFGANDNKPEFEFHLLFCRVDTYSFGMTSGRHVVANSWQGTAEGIKVVPAS
jgi:hypothetical protein